MIEDLLHLYSVPSHMKKNKSGLLSVKILYVLGATQAKLSAEVVGPPL
jgi:hypothetical protein